MLTAAQEMLQNYYLSALVVPAVSIQNYDRLYESRLDPWQRTLVALNISGLELTEQNWQQSALFIEALSTEPPAPSDYLQALWQNRALTHWLEAVNQQKSPYRSDQEDALNLLKLAQEELSKSLVDSSKEDRSGKAGASRSPDEFVKVATTLKQQILQQTERLQQFKEQSTLKGAKEFLKNLINSQQKNLKTVLWQQNGKYKEISPIKAQQDMLALASDFIPRLIEEQELLYHHKGLCQCSPWDRLIPLFERGVAEAQQATVSLKKNPPVLGMAALNMRHALTAWKEAFMLFDEQQNPVPQESSLEDPSTVKDIWRSLQKASSSESPMGPIASPPKNSGERQW